MSKHNFGSVLKRLQIDRSTGSLVCVGEDSMFGRVYLVDGLPKAARCRHQKGREAMEQLQQAQLTSIKYYDKVNLIKTDLVDPDITGFALDDSAPAVADLGAAELSAEPEIDLLVDDTVNRARRDNRLTDKARAILIEELVEYVGPVASTVVDGLGDDIGAMDAVRLLANEIGDPQMAKQFVGKVKQKL